MDIEKGLEISILKFSWFVRLLFFLPYKGLLVYGSRHDGLILSSLIFRIVNKSLMVI